MVDIATPWSHVFDNFMIFKQALDDFIADIYPTIRFTISYDFKVTGLGALTPVIN